MSSLPAATASVGELAPIQFELLMMGEKLPETCRASIAIKSILERCILLVILKGIHGMKLAHAL